MEQPAPSRSSIDWREKYIDIVLEKISKDDRDGSDGDFTDDRSSRSLMSRTCKKKKKPRMTSQKHLDLSSDSVVLSSFCSNDKRTKKKDIKKDYSVKNPAQKNLGGKR